MRYAHSAREVGKMRESGKSAREGGEMVRENGDGESFYIT